MDIPRDGRGILVTEEPIYLWWTERENRDLLGRKHPPDYGFMPEIWKCREHPDWQGEDIPEDQVVSWEETGEFANWPGGPRALWLSDSVQAHVALHASRDIHQR